MNLARKVLGRDAPIHECIAAILAWLTETFPEYSDGRCCPALSS